MTPETRSAVLADYLGATPETAPELYGTVEILQCLGCLRDTREVPVESNSFLATRCDYCAEYLTSSGIAECLTAPDPLTPGRPADVWLGVLVRHCMFDGLGINDYGRGYFGQTKAKCLAGPYDPDPVPAIVRAMMAADPAFAARMEGAKKP